MIVQPMHYFRFLLICLILTALACQRYVMKPVNEEKYTRQFNQSLESTKSIADERRFDNLMSPTLDSAQLSWHTINGQPYVLTVMLKNDKDLKYYKNDCNTGFYNTGSRYNWVTLVPQMKKLCRQNRFGRKEGVNLRLEQALGLKIDTLSKSFIEVWVKPEDLIRPCRDPEITNRTCSLMLGDTTNAEYKTFLAWLHSSTAGYPFTELGYTYDWNKRNHRHEGLSEFLIDKGSDVVVKDFVEVCDYCFVKGVRKGNHE